jgi:histidine triad (HIT) family protein
MTDCIFCKIAAGAIPADVVDQNDHAMAFRDLNPQASTHVLVIPKTHVASAAELEPAHGAMLGALFALAARVAKSEGLDQGWRLVANVGPHAGQTVHHLHVHLIGGRPMSWPPG